MENVLSTFDRTMVGKWRKYDAHRVAFAPDNPLGQWRNMVQELYEIKLKIPGDDATGGN